MQLTAEALKAIQLDEIRHIRNRLLGDADKLVNTAEDKGLDSTPYRKYRQQLRDIPQTYQSNPEGVVWPQKPLLPQASA
ncbi:phage tail assembly chaperone [Vibrio alginolyticus]|uniref:phage tail assembly chaperone n=1 Tax=Vibrio alginolyticus TaxID=663 RepID=UPI0037540F7A